MKYACPLPWASISASHTEIQTLPSKLFNGVFVRLLVVGRGQTDDVNNLILARLYTPAPVDQIVSHLANVMSAPNPHLVCAVPLGARRQLGVDVFSDFVQLAFQILI